jgi:lysozyme
MNVQELIKRHEGLSLTPYKCPAGHWTVGYGHNLDAHSEPVPESITLERAEQYLAQDIQNARHDCEMFISCWNDLNETRQAVLIDMCFNIGTSGLLRFHRLIRNLELKYFAYAALEMMHSLWAEQVPERAAELSKLMETGKWS